MVENKYSREMPQSIESENAVVTGILLFDFKTDLQPADFYSTENAVLMKAYRDFKSDNPIVKPDLKVFQSYMDSHCYEDGITYQAKLNELNSNLAVKLADGIELTSDIFSYHCQQVKDCAKRRATIERIIKIAEDAYNPKYPIDKTINSAVNSISLLNIQRKLPFKFYNLSERLEKIDEQFTKNHESKPYSSGFRYLDECLGGGFHAGELVQLGGMTGTGKTTFALSVTANLLEQEHDVMYCSLEMIGEELTAKLYSLYMHKITAIKDSDIDPKLTRLTAPYKDIQYGNVKGKDRTERLRDAMLRVSQLSTHLFVSEGTASIGVDDIIELMKQHYLTYKKMPFLVVDYMQLLAPHNERGTDKQNADYSTLKLKQLATGNALADVLGVDASELKTVVLTIVANNRNSNAQTATESSGRDSSTLEYTADTLLSIEPSELKNVEGKDAKKDGQRVVDDMKAKAIRELDIKLVKCRCKNPPAKQSMPSFRVYHGAYFEELPCAFKEAQDGDYESR